MFCYNCGCELTENDFCTACGVDVIVYKRIIKMSNRYYNDGLAKAKVRDLSGAAEALRQSLKCNKYNTDARNLLGLVYFEMGDAVEALSEWVISKNFQNDRNIADDYLARIQKNPTKWESVGQAIKKYNQALEYCRQDGLDLAVIQLKAILKLNPKMVKANQLLALIYMDAGEWDRAEKCVKRVFKVDAKNTLALHYQKEIDAAKRETEPEPESGKKSARDDVVTYVSGNETIIQPINHPDKTGYGAVILNILIGLVIGLAIMWYLVLPARIQSAKQTAENEVLEISNQLAEKSASVDEINKQLETLQRENQELTAKLSEAGSSEYMQAVKSLIQASRDYLASPDTVVEIAAKLALIDPAVVESEDADEAFRSLYAYLYEHVGKKASSQLLETGLESLKDEKFEDAVTAFKTAYDYDNSNVEALYNLGHALRRLGNKEKAKEAYELVVSNFPDSEYAKNAKDYIDGNVEDGDESAEDDDTSPEEHE